MPTGTVCLIGTRAHAGAGMSVTGGRTRHGSRMVRPRELEPAYGDPPDQRKIAGPRFRWAAWISAALNHKAAALRQEIPFFCRTKERVTEPSQDGL